MKILGILIAFFSIHTLASDTVRFNDYSKLVIKGTTNVEFNLGVDTYTGDSSSEASAAKVYLPIASGVANQIDYSTLKVNSGVSALFDITSVSHFVSFPLLITVGSPAKYIYMAVRGGASGSSYYVSAKSTLAYSNQTNSLVNFAINPKDICKSVIANNISSVCNPTTGGLDPSSVTSVLFKPMLYFFLSDEVIAVDGLTSVVPANANYSGGVYIESQMSNRIYDTSAIVVSLGTLNKGDGRIIGTFSANNSIDSNYFKKVLVYQYTEASTPVVTNIAPGAASAGAFLAREISTNQSGEFTLNGLNNGQAYKISISFMDKFLFSTALSTSQAATPMQIEELLKKQACYLLTAGFGEEHFVINYFRDYRDHVLMHSVLGRAFVNLYYKTAPQYALVIYQHAYLRFLIRLVAYFFYGVLKFGWLAILSGMVGFWFHKLRKNKEGDSRITL